eukprot:TRINITY_DN23664_c0_g1_i1.p1 TRINITY_DN23664_c0_g1~~TRINITY_DN23664_c0_g1_i1.p1  ORF type:complete len:322 (+),score=101.04 TRINITY_DN23664_c0_g1_i1:117-1082(+)
MPDELGGVKLLPTCGCLCCCFWTIFTIVAIPLSFKSLEQGRYGLLLDWQTQKVSEEVISEPGMKSVGLGNTLIEYPSTFQSMYLAADYRPSQHAHNDIVRGAVRARSMDGLEMKVSVSFQWKLETLALHELYTILGDHLYQDEFVRFSRQAVVLACADFRADQFFTNRTLIADRMESAMAEAFNKPDDGLSVSIKGLQLRQVDLPDNFDAEISRTQEEMQEVEVALAERDELKTAKQQDVVVAEQRKNALLEVTKGRVQAIEIESMATVDMLLQLQEEVAVSNALILRQFENDTEPVTRLMELMEVQAVQDHNLAKLLINL